jgi:hypothetical protein
MAAAYHPASGLSAESLGAEQNQAFESVPDSARDLFTIMNDSSRLSPVSPQCEGQRFDPLTVCG